MNFNKYQEKAWETVRGYASINRFIHAINAEAGELAGAYDKFLRGDYDENALDQRLIYEMGDILWSLAALCTAMGIDMEQVATLNVDKLASRAERGVIQGDGDDR